MSLLLLTKRQAIHALRHNGHCDVGRDSVRAPPVCHPARAIVSFH